MAPAIAPDAHTVRFCDLGPLFLQIGGVERSPGGRRPTAALASLLMNANRRVSADALREAMWGDEAGRHAASTLETHIFRLRRVIEPGRRPGQPPTMVINEPGGYRLVVSPDQVDSMRFAQLAVDAAELLRTGQADRALRRSSEALDLWRGRPFSPVADEVWAATSVARLQELHAQTQESRIEAVLECGKPEQALHDLEAMVAEHPLRERLWAHRMIAAYRCGRSNEALQMYQRARQLLVQELGIEPGRELRELHAAVLAGDESRLGRRAVLRPSRESEGSLSLPRRAGALIGREADISQVRALCSENSLVTITGAGGCGKTRLAVEVAHELGAQFVDGVWFVDLTTVQDDDQVADAVVSALGLAPAITGGPVDMVRLFVRDRRMLLVLDNCEHVLGGAAQLVNALLVPGSEVAILATSREPLLMHDEVTVALGPLPVPDLDDGLAGDRSEVEDNPAVRLFLERAGAWVPDAEDRRKQIGVVAQICRSLDGVPLAVELAAARVKAFSLVEIARQVTNDAAALSQVRRGAPAHQRSVGLAVEWSHRMLTPSERLTHRRVSLIPGSFTAAAAAQVTGLDASELEDVLVALVHKSMLVALGPARPSGPSRFAQLATIRAHGGHELATHGEGAATGRLRDQWVVSLVDGKPRVGHRDERPWFNALEDDYACVRATLHDTLRVRKDPLGCFVAGRLNMFWFFRGLVPEAGRWFVLAREVPSTPALDRALVTFGLAGERGLAQRMDVAAPLIDEGLQIGAHRTSDQDIVFGEGLVQLAGGVMLAGDQALAADLAQRALWIAEQHDDASLALIARARLAMNPTGDSADLVSDVFQQAVVHENHYAAFLAANGGTVRALAQRDAAVGLHWSDLIIALNRRHEIGQAPVVLEIRANLLTLAGKPSEALRLYSAARFHNARAGVPWPSRDVTSALLAEASAQVDRTEFDAAWEAGRHVTLADVTPLTGDLIALGPLQGR